MLNQFFSENGFMPHGHCYLWNPSMLWLHITSDALIALAYFSIPFTLVYFVRKRKDMEFNWMFICFAIFIIACGTTHLMEILVIWHPYYWLSGAVKLITMLASVPTAILLVRLIPTALALPSPTALKRANAELSKEIDERKRADEKLKHTAVELTRSNADLEQFAYVASHDLQEPLRAVGGFVGILARHLDKQLDEKGRTYMGHVQEGVTRMQTLIGDLLAYSRVSRGRPSQPTDCTKIVQTVLSDLASTISTKGVAIECAPLPTVIADPTHMAQLFQNLITNAIKFSSGEKPEIQIGATQEDDHWTFFVRDNGIGIDPQFYERIFVIFQRLHTRAAYPGTGIGLAICKRIVERHGGRIWLESQPGKGSTFFFTVPNEQPKPS